MKLREVYNTSPFGFVSSFLIGVSHSAVFSLLAVYATSMNFSIFEVSIVTFLLAISGAISQWPIGKLSDIFDRRLVIIYSTFGSSVFAFFAIILSEQNYLQLYLHGGLSLSKLLFYICVMFFSFCSLPMFALIFAHTNDYIKKEKFVAAGAGLQFIFGLGAMCGPFLCSLFMEFLGQNGFFIFLIIFHSIIGFFGLYRMQIRESGNNPDSQFAAMPQTITPIGIELNPSTKPFEEKNDLEKLKKNW